MKVLSLFDGISCGMVALERAGIPVERYVAYEIEPNVIKISKKNYPQIEHCGDVTIADFTQYKGFDLLIGGSPCQSLSIVQSKTRQHLDGKSKLFFEFVRAKEEMNPAWFLFENVASMNEESKQAISELLGCQPIFIDSGDFSAQERPRYYWTNIPICAEHPKNATVLKNVMLPAEEVHDKYWYDFPIENLDMKKQVCGTLVHSNHEMHKRVFNPNFKCHTLTCVSGGNQQKKVFQNGKARKLTPLEYERLQTLPDNYTAGIADGHRYTAIGNGWTVDVIAHIFTYLKKQEREEKQMEFKMKPYNPVEQILFNYEELKAEIQEKAAMYATLVYTDETIKEAKADKANLNKLKKALNDERIKREKEYMQPFNDFKTKINELIRIIDEPIGIIDKQIKEVDEQKKAEKLNQIQAYWNNVTSPDHPLTLQRVMNPKWLNATASMKSIQDEINGILAKYAEDIATLQNLPEYGFEAIEVYKVSLDLRNAMNEAHRLSEMAKRKAEAERIAAERKAAEEAKKAEEIPCTPYKEPVATVTATANINGESVPVASVQVETPQRMWVSFQAYLTNEDAYALADFFNSRNIPFEPVKSVTFDEREQYLVSKVFQAYYNMGIDEIAEEDEAAKAILKKFELI